MIRILSWILVFCIALYFFGIMGLAFVSPSLIPVISVVVFLLALIRERIKDKEAEKNDLNKY